LKVYVAFGEKVNGREDDWRSLCLTVDGRFAGRSKKLWFKTIRSVQRSDRPPSSKATVSRF